MAGVLPAAVPPAHVEALRERWRIAFAAAEAALDANAETLPAAEIGAWRNGLRVERDETSALLRALAHDRQAGFVPEPLLTRAQARRAVHLPDEVEACVFNLDGVLVGSAAVHAAAWEALRCLTPAWRQVIVASYGLDGQPPRSLADLGRQYGVTRACVWQWR